ncbi:MAG: M20/M25/M40 family metallo-hydrolase [Acidobacteria bacterium]|nr:M20/M25/M40 family metallo-hydrolase [Acidobacteriota bacterium]MBS1865830.1 M20/M25/M40 family metallo-hydrolase [Acidobacteriota bacterium]
MRKRALQLFVNCAVVSVILPSMPARSAIPFSSGRAVHSAQFAQNPQTQAALAWFKSHLAWINDEQARLTEIPAPPFAEGQRAQAVKVLLAAFGLEVHLDKAGNVIGELRGTNEREVVLIAAHLDTVFPAGTDVRVRREKDRMYAPGISDNGTGLVSLVAIARALHEARIKPQRTILFVADVGEEGEGNLRGMRALVETYRDRLKAVVVLDGSGTDHVTTKALASRRMEAVITGPGGHSWSDFGIPNPINALVRGSVRFLNTRVPATPRTTFNLGQVEGGTSVNSIPHEARLKVDVRSESEDELLRLENALRECMAAGVRDEMESARDRSKGKLEWKVEILGSRPGGELAGDSPLLAALRAADDYVSNASRIERASTDANIPLSLGIDAIAIGAGGNGGGAHSLQEWYEPAGRELGLQRALLTTLGVSGIANEKGK